MAPPQDPGADLAGVVLADARTGEPFDLGTAGPLLVLSVIRHRY